jgi:hypothetical protein
MYQHDGDKKTAQALPNMMQLAARMGGSQVDEGKEFKVTPLKGKEKIAGYKCDGIEGTDGEMKFEAWMTDALGMDMKDTYGQMMQQFGKGMDQNAWKNVSGMMLKSVSYDKEGKMTSSMIAKEV